MTPVKMETTSDCFRACLASLLNLPLRDTIDLANGTKPGAYMSTAALLTLQDWMLVHDAYPIFLPLIAPDQQNALQQLQLRTPDVHVMLAGHTRKGVVHAVLVRDGAVVHDPSPVYQGELSPYDLPGGGSVYQVFMIGKIV